MKTKLLKTIIIAAFIIGIIPNVAISQKKSLESGKIDVHHHIVPQGYLDLLAQKGITTALGTPFPEWSPEISLKFMEKVGIQTAIVSISSPGVYFKDDKDFSLKISRWCNEYIAQLKRDYPGQFGGFACIPLGFVEESIDELIYAIDTLELDGVCLLSNYDGVYLGDAKYDSFFKELNKRKAVVYIHPTDPCKALDPHLQETGFPNSRLEVLFETTRTVSNLIYTGTTYKYDKIDYILSHGGGTVPYVAYRIALASYTQQGQDMKVGRALYDLILKREPDYGLKVLRRMFYDTAFLSGEYAYNTLNEFAGSSQIVYGTDFPFSTITTVTDKNLDKHPDFTNDDLKKIHYQNCVKLFELSSSTE